MILIVEDEPLSRRALWSLLSTSGFEAVAVSSAEEAVRLLDNGQVPEVALVDLNLPGMSGMEFIRRLGRSHPGVRPVLVTAASPENLHAARYPDSVEYMRKPINVRHLLSLLSNAAHLSGYVVPTFQQAGTQ